MAPLEQAQHISDGIVFGFQVALQFLFHTNMGQGFCSLIVILFLIFGFEQPARPAHRVEEPVPPRPPKPPLDPEQRVDRMLEVWNAMTPEERRHL